MVDKLFKGAFIFAAGAAAGAVAAMWLMSDKGEEMRNELRDIASQAKTKMQDCYEQVKHEMEAEHGQEGE